MGKVTMAGAGGGADLDIITAAANDVLAGKVIVGPDGEPLTGILSLTGTAADSQVLAGQSYYNTDAKTKRTGTMANRGAVSQALNAGGTYTIPAGYHNGSGKVTANSLASQTSGNATAAQIYNGYTAWVNGSKVTGTMPSMGGQTITPGAAQQTISCSGKYMTGNIVVQGAQIFKNISGSATSSNTRIAVKNSNGAQYYFYYVDISLGFTPVEGLVLGGSQGAGTHIGSGSGVHKMGGSYGGYYGNLSNNNGVLFFTSNKCRFFVDEPNTTYWFFITGY